MHCVCRVRCVCLLVLLLKSLSVVVCGVLCDAAWFVYLSFVCDCVFVCVLFNVFVFLCACVLLCLI